MSIVQDEVGYLLALDIDTVHSEAEAAVLMDRLKDAHGKVAGALEDQMAELGLKFEISVYLGDYGSGRSLALTDDDWSSAKRGDWVSSASNC